MRLTATVCAILLLTAQSAFASPDDTPGAAAAASGDAPTPTGALDPGAGGGAVSPPGSAGVCTGVTCAGHGNCVEYKGAPACSCAEGYMPDTVNGLNCLPLRPLAVVARPTPPPEEKAPLSEQARVERAMGGRNLQLEYQLYMSEAAGQISFAQYMWDATTHRKNGFAACTIIGVLSVGAALGMYFATMWSLFESEEKMMTYLFSALGCGAFGGLMLGLGIHGLRHERSTLSTLDALLFEERNGRPIARRWALSPYATAGGAGLMAAIEL